MLKWQCRGCKVKGQVDIVGQDVWRLMHEVEDFHKALAPECNSILLFPEDERHNVRIDGTDITSDRVTSVRVLRDNAQGE